LLVFGRALSILSNNSLKEGRCQGERSFPGGLTSATFRAKC